MAKRATASDRALISLRERGLAYPGAHTKSPWPGHLDLAVKDKTFAYLSLEGEPFSIGCKLPESSAIALELPFCAPTPYGLGRFDLILAIDTLQSSSIDDRALLRHLVQQRLTPRGAVLLGVANCRYLDGEVVHGARMKNFRQPELGAVIKDVAFYRKYLQQHARTVHVTGKHELLITALPIA